MKKRDNKKDLNNIVNFIITTLCYMLVLIIVSFLFDSVKIDSNYYGMWALIATIIITLLNKTIKPILVWLTLPITGVTLGLFYPVINVIILKITDLILGSHFQIKGIFISFFIAIVISILNMLMDILIINPIRKGM